MAKRSYNNDINPIEVSIAVEQLLIAPYPTNWTPGRIDLGSPPAGFFHLGAVVDDTPSLKTTKEKFELKGGIPSVTQYEVTTGLSGSFDLSLHSNSWRKAQYAMGNYSAVSSTQLITGIASVVNEYTIVASAVTSLVVGQQYTISTTARFDAPDTAESVITDINTVTKVVMLSPTPITTPTTAMVLGKYDYVKQAIGTSKIQQVTLLGVADFIDGVQVVHHVVKARSAADTTEELRPGQNQRMPLSFTMYGVNRSDVPGSSGDELILAYRYYFPKSGT